MTNKISTYFYIIGSANEYKNLIEKKPEPLKYIYNNGFTYIQYLENLIHDHLFHNYYLISAH